VRKILRKFVTLVLLISLIGSIAYTSSASTAKSKNDMISSFTYRNSTVETYEDSNYRLVKYFENDICIQESLLIKDTGDIYYNDISSRMYTSKSLDNLTISNFNYVQKYNLSDFVTNFTEPETQNRAYEEPVTYSFIRSKSWYDDNAYNFARLYGGTSMKAYSTRSWVFAIGASFTLVCTALGFIPGVAGLILTAVEVVGGLLMDVLLVEEWYRDYFWKYMINQVYPTTDRFTAYSTEYVYERYKRYNLNDGGTDYELVYTSDYYNNSPEFQEELVNNIGYYFIF